jgi:uncharacterized protein (DUF305 family)
MKRMHVIPMALAALTLGLTACGEEESTVAADDAAGNGADRAFVAEMIPHHRSAVDMADVAAERSKRPEIKQLAETIVTTQNAEIEEMEGFDQRLQEAGVEQGDLGIPAHEMGMDMDASMLEEAEPFDREFIDMMIPHHQGAIRMARAKLEMGENPELGRLAEQIIDAQSKEIDEMNRWRVEWFGGLSPAGGVPAEGEDSDHGV